MRRIFQAKGSFYNNSVQFGFFYLAHTSLMVDDTSDVGAHATLVIFIGTFDRFTEPSTLVPT